MSYRCYLVLSLWSVLVTCQDIDPNLQKIVESIFTSPRTNAGTSTTPTPRPTRRRLGAGDVVTPEPFIGPTSSPQILEVNGDKCICVPYYMCDPANNTISTGGEFDGFGQIDIRFDSNSCQDILDVCCKEDKRVTEAIRPKPLIERPERAQGCGIRNVGGIDFSLTGNVDNEAGFGEFPWTIALIKIPEENCLCHGSLIQPNIILTAYHCVLGVNPSQIKVRAGEWDTQTTKERLPYQERVATRIIGHQLYNPKNLAFDFALIVVNLPFEFDDHINIICLPPPNYTPSGKNCYASGWGKDIFGLAGKFSVIMKSVKLPIVPFRQCQNRLRRTRLTQMFRLDQSFICAGGQPGIDTCTGDGGAPLVCPVGPASENRYAEMGIVSWGIGCKENHPAAYANVPLARNWIDENVIFLGGDPRLYSY